MKEYTIRELSEMFGLPASTIRYYEDEGILTIPIEVYFPQYFAKIFFAYFETATMETGISGTHARSTRDVRQSIQTQTANRSSGAIREKKNCGRYAE